jgi:hypothetical protein
MRIGYKLRVYSSDGSVSYLADEAGLFNWHVKSLKKATVLPRSQFAMTFGLAGHSEWEKLTDEEFYIRLSKKLITTYDGSYELVKVKMIEDSDLNVKTKARSLDVS